VLSEADSCPPVRPDIDARKVKLQSRVSALRAETAPKAGYFEQLRHVAASNHVSSREYALAAHFGMDGGGARSQI
jgi:hypothetical protein